MEDLISIVITTYKRSDKIEEAIKSAMSQTYRNIEIIVVDDNAKAQDERNKTEKIVEKYKSVIYIQNKENLGGALSRNVGIKNAKGKFIAFLDDDDKYTKDKIEKQYQCYEQHRNDKVGLIYCYCYRENEKGNIVGSYQNDYEGNRIYEQMLGCIARNIFMVLSKRCVNICWNV